jgi:hypothetical protein
LTDKQRINYEKELAEKAKAKAIAEAKLKASTPTAKAQTFEIEEITDDDDIEEIVIVAEDTIDIPDVISPPKDNLPTKNGNDETFPSKPSLLLLSSWLSLCKNACIRLAINALV